MDIKQLRRYTQGFINQFLEAYTAGGRSAFRIKSVIFVAFTVPVMLLAAFNYVKTSNDLTEFTFLRRQSVANISASTLRTLFDQLIEVGTAIAGNGTADMIAHEDWPALATHLSNAHLSLPDLDSILIADADGVVQAATPSNLADTIGSDQKNFDWYRTVSRNWTPTISNVYRPSHLPGFAVVGVAIPLRDEENIVRGIMVMQMRADTVLAWTRQINSDADTFIFFTDRVGRIGIHPLIGPDSTLSADYSAFSPVKRALNLERGVEILYDFRVGAEVMAAYEPVPRYGWTAIVEQQTRSAFTLRRAETNYVLAIYGVILLLNTTVALFLIKILTIISTLRRRENAVVGAIGEGLIVTDHRGVVTRVNHAACSMLGLAESEVLNQPINELLWVYDEHGTEPLSHANQPIVRAIEGNNVSGKFAFMPKNQGRFPVALTATPLHQRSTTDDGAVAIFRDITKEEELDRAKKEFISVASHELLTPVSATQAFLSMLLGGDFGAIEAKQKVYLEKLLSLNQRMVELVDDLLNVSRLELGVLESAAEPVNITQVIQSEIKQIAPLAGAKHLTITEQYVDEIPTLLIAPKLLRLVMQNLLSNAIKYTPDGGTVTVRLTRTSDKAAEDAALIAVSDTGIGIPKAQQAAIFSKFFRAENVREKEIAGTGLGLFIVRDIITLFKGGVWFESEENKGTTFTVSLPIKKIG